MSTLIQNPELAAYVAAYDREDAAQNGGEMVSLLSHYDEVKVIEGALEVLDLLRAHPSNGLTREQIWEMPDRTTGYFLQMENGGAENVLFFVPSETAQKVLPLLRADGGGGTPLGTIEYFCL